jgi:hypothetical protein
MCKTTMSSSIRQPATSGATPKANAPSRSRAARRDELACVTAGSKAGAYRSALPQLQQLSSAMPASWLNCAEASNPARPPALPAKESETPAWVREVRLQLHVSAWLLSAVALGMCLAQSGDLCKCLQTCTHSAGTEAAKAH